MRGHSVGFDKLLEVVQWCVAVGIPQVTVYAFSTDNFNRSEEEVEELMRLFRKGCERMAEEEGQI